MLSKSSRRLNSIQAQLNLGIGLILVLGFIIAIIGYVSLSRLQTGIQVTLEEASRIRELSLKIESEFLLARQDEASFLTGWRSMGTNAASVQYVSSNQNHLELARTYLGNLESLVQTAHAVPTQSMTDDILKLRPLLDKYNTAFRLTVGYIMQRSRVEGLPSAMAGVLGELEATVAPLPNPELIKLILRMQANERSYQSTGRREYVDNASLLVNEFTTVVKQSAPADLTVGNIPLAASALVEQAEVYQALFDELVALDAQIETNTTIFQQVTTDISQVTGRIDKQSEADLADARAQLQTAGRQSTLALGLTTALALGLGTLAAAFLARRIIRPLSHLTQAAQRMGQGDLSQPVTVAGGDELVTLAKAFNMMAGRLRQMLTGLEQQVADRTAELSQASASLSRRVNQLQASSEVSRAVTTVTDPEQLVPRVVELIQQRFDFYYVGLFLVDADNRYAVLQAGMGAGSAHEAGRTMKERGHRLQVGSQSMVGWVCANKQARIALDVGDEPVRFANPLLPDTHSEMALPLHVGERMLGALDVQSTQVAAFDENDVAVLQSMADQVAVTLENARLFQQTQTALKDLEATNRLLARQGWQEYLGEARATRRAEFRVQDPRQGGAGLPGQEAGLPSGLLTIPLELRGQSLGRLSLRREGDHPWSEEDIQMVRTVVLQTALAADNARLFEATQGALDESRALYQSSRQITAAGEMSEVLSAVLDNLARTGIHAAAVALFDAPTREQAQHIELVGAWDHTGTPRLAPGVRFAIADFPLFNRITSEGTLVSSDLLADPEVDDMARTVLGGLGLRAMAVTPLVARGQWIGVLFALVEQPHTFTPAEINFQRALADQAAVAIDSRRLFADVQRRAEREALVRQITTRIRAAGDIQGVLETTATELARSMGVSRAIVRLTMGDKDAFTEKEL